MSASSATERRVEFARGSGERPCGEARRVGGAARGATVPARGFTLVELMVAIAIGMILTTGLAVLFANTSDSYGELHKQSQQIENGRYAVDLLRDDLAHAGFYGALRKIPPTPGSLPDPCDISASALATAPYGYLAYAVQGYNSPATSPLSCLPSANHRSRTDILVVRRADTERVVAAPKSNEVYLQASVAGLEVQFGNPSGFALPKLNSDNTVNTVGTKADGSQTATVLQMDNVAGASPHITLARVAGDIRKLHVHIYYVSPCSRYASGSSVCTSAADGGNPIPTLKRLELTAAGGTTELVERTLVEGVENLQLEYAVDNTPATSNLITGFPGDGVPDTYIRDPATGTPGGAQRWADVVGARVYVLARNTQASTAFADDKTYEMGLEGTYTPPTGWSKYRRHLYTAEVRLVNLSSRREAPL